MTGVLASIKSLSNLWSMPLDEMKMGWERRNEKRTLLYYN